MKHFLTCEGKLKEIIYVGIEELTRTIVEHSTKEICFTCNRYLFVTVCF